MYCRSLEDEITKKWEQKNKFEQTIFDGHVTTSHFHILFVGIKHRVKKLWALEDREIKTKSRGFCATWANQTVTPYVSGLKTHHATQR